VSIAVLAHETWFTLSRPPYEWSFAWAVPSLLLISGAIGVAAAWRIAGRRIPRPELPLLAPLGRLWPWVPRLLAVHAGVSLLAQAARGTFLAPSLELPSDALGASVRIAEGVLGVWLISGFRVRGAAFAVAAAGPIGMVAYGVVPILERLDLLGIAVFLALVPPGPDAWGASRVPADGLVPALAALRTLVGGSLIVLAFSEKLARPALALAFLERFPAFNLMRTLGVPISDLAFVRVAGAIELLFGLLLVSGALPQLVVILAGIPFNATLFFLGTDELIGHLPIYGAMLALLIYGSSPETAGVVDRFRSRVPRRPADARRDSRTSALPVRQTS
jgi:hypothetical protein